MQEIVKYHNDLNKVRIPNFNELQQNIFFGLIARLKGNSDEVLFTAQELNEFVKDKKYTNKELFLEVNKLKENLFKADFTSILKNKNSLDIGYHNIFKSFYMRVNTIDTSEIPYDKIDKVYELPNGAIFHSFEHLRVAVNPKFAEIVNALSNFTRFELAEFMSLSGKYTKTLYRLLKQYRQTGYMHMEWDEFKRILDIPECYRQIDIDQQILKPAIKELTAERNLFDTKRIPFKDLSYTKIKGKGRGRGGNVIAIRFDFKPEQIQELESQTEKAKPTNTKEPNLKAYCGLYVDIPTTQGRVTGKITNIYDTNEKIIMEIIDENFNTTNLPFNNLESLEKCVNTYKI